jgi:hypothetical protein
MTKEELEILIKKNRAILAELEALHYKLYVCKKCNNTGMVTTPYWNIEKDWEYCDCECGKSAEENNCEPGNV